MGEADIAAAEGFGSGIGAGFFFFLASALWAFADCAEDGALLERGVAHRWNGRAGLSRVLLAMVTESFGEMRRLPRFSGRKLGAGIATMTWDALREQIETPPMIGRRDERLMRVKTYIEAKLADPELSVERIAHACNISVRGLHRLFAEDPAGSVSS